MAATLNAEDIALILAAIEGSIVLPMKTDVTPLALEASLAPLALEASLAVVEANVAALMSEGRVKTLILASGGTAYNANDLIRLVQSGAYGCIIEVLTVDAGAILTWRIISAGYGYSEAAGLSTTGHTGDATFDIASVHTDAAAMAVNTLFDTGTTLDAYLAAIQVDTQAILEDTGTTLPAAIAVVDGIVDDILVDTGTTLDGKIDAIVVTTPPTVGEIVDAVMDSLVADHVVAGSLSAVVAALDAGLITSVAGIGSVSNTVTVEVGGVAEAGVDVWVTSDEAGATVVAGTLQSDALGQVVFWLDPGTYWVWQQKSGFNFTNPDELIVT